ncbi:haloalkane dehalogenase [Nonomuraea dietziae]|uniref:Haloalkane dehalogenase n=1 Tax=Nonomuraea dietziae TaxID=65515 RepID=A0A7W5YD27_9ACTN|nr:haloalkane dehalogenase [Nonomuraea dietziae]MBB3733041.1 haloalkane dehalogenase [Nonomuraea dietziae]
MNILRTPDDRFENLPDFPFEPHYVELDDGIRVHYLDERPERPSGETVLLLHGEPTWSYLYRHVIPPLVAAGHRCVAPDLVGFGRSDKPADRFAYTYQSHVDWLRETVFDRLDLRDVTMVCHDWGGLLGLRLMAEHPDRFRRVVATNTVLHAGDQGDMGPFYAQWLQHSQRVRPFSAGQVVATGTVTDLDPAVVAAYDAPFPEEDHVQGARRFPLLIPITPADEAAPANRKAWEVLESLDTPFLCAFSDRDFVLGQAHTTFRERVPGAKGLPHTTIVGGGHFVQEDQGPRLAQIVDDFIRSAAR